MNNTQIRIKLIKKRMSLSNIDKVALDNTIQNKLIKLFKQLPKNKYIGLYYPINNEVNTKKILNFLLKNKYLICLPKVNSKTMKFAPISSANFEYETWKSIKQPKTNYVVNPKNIQLIIVPLVGYTSSNYRMGYGMNFYNNYLRKHPTKSIGIAYSFQLCNDINVTKKDIPLDKIICE